MERKRRPGFLTQYAAHAGISLQAAAEQLKRVSIDYLQYFDFAEADKLRAAARHADRAPFAKPIYPATDSEMAGDQLDDPTPKDPAFAELQRRREHFRAELSRLDFEERIQKLSNTDQVKTEAFRVGRLVRDALLNVPSRLAGILAAENDQSKIHDLLEQEIRQALEVLATDEQDTEGPVAA